MKMNYVIVGLTLSMGVLSSCGGETVSTEVTKKKEQVKTDTASVSMNEEDYKKESLKNQYVDIVVQIKDGTKENLNMYLDKTSTEFSLDDWEYIDFSYPEYYETFKNYTTYSDLPDANVSSEPTKVVSVYFETEVDGMIMESAAMIYFQEKNGFIWIVGCELAG